MESSLEEALRLFSKWDTESSLITILFRTPEGGSSCVGVISALSSDLMVVSAPNSNNEPSGNNSYLYFNQIEEINYKDGREIDWPQTKGLFDYILEIKLKSGATAMLYTNP
jgi:hypothetical protein